MKKILSLSVWAFALSCVGLFAQNPYLPMWEYIPDGEPYVFEDPDKAGEYRVYVYGSHDSLLEYYCGREQVVWSAPVNDLSAWRYDGVIFTNRFDRDGNLLNADGTGDVLYAPDVAVRKENGRNVYYLYPNVQSGERGTLVARSYRPDGPFEVCNWDPENPRRTVGVLGFDPAVFVDDDGRVYGYWGFGESWGAEFDPATMASVKPGCEPVHNMISGQDQDGVFRFFEASSMRKIKDKYILVYSRMMQDGEFGLPKCNYNLAWAYSRNPLGPFTYGGTLIDGRARETLADGTTVCTANPYGNTHGSIVEINGQWWVFYHRQTGTDEYSRQAMVAPISVEVEEGPDGKVRISEAEYNSMGFRTEGLNPLDKSAAGWACYLVGPEGVKQEYPHFYHSGSYVKASRMKDAGTFVGPFNLKEPFCPVVNNTAGSIVGYKYFNFDHTAGARQLRLSLDLVPEAGGSISVFVGAPSAKRGGIRIGETRLEAASDGCMRSVEIDVKPLAKVKGKQALYFVFDSPQKGKSVCRLYSFRFSK